MLFGTEAKQGRETAHRAPVASPVQAVEQPVRTDSGEDLRELSPIETAVAFFREFDRILARIRQNEQVIQSARLIHGPDDVLRLPAASTNSDSETLHERDAR